MFLHEAMPLHAGEVQVRAAMHAPPDHNPTFVGLSPQLANHLQIAPLISIGTLDAEGRPWAALWGDGSRDLGRAIGEGLIGVRTAVPAKHDPVIEALMGKENVVRPTVGADGRPEPGKMIAGLTIDLETRKRVKLFGRMMAAGLGSKENDDESGNKSQAQSEIQLVVNIEQSLGNCPKYLNSKHIEPALSEPELIQNDELQLSPEARELLSRADLFFVSSVQGNKDMDLNHRGGPAGFLRAVPEIKTNPGAGTVLVWPEYSGNRLYQTLGNFATDPRAGLCVPDFTTGSVLYLTGTVEILRGADAESILPRTNLCVRFTTIAARFVARALPFRGIEGAASPYNPNVRYLTSEKTPLGAKSDTDNSSSLRATLLDQTILTPSISRFRFTLPDAAQVPSDAPGQYVTLDFSEHLDQGYSHMREDDPRSLNDDHIRTFTVSSAGAPTKVTVPSSDNALPPNEFEMTIKRVGTATDFLFRHGHSKDRGRLPPLELAIKGFGGDFRVQPQEAGKPVGFLAAGVGITPLLPVLSQITAKETWLNPENLRLLWTTRAEDLGLIEDTLTRHPSLSKSLTLFVTGLYKAGDVHTPVDESKAASAKAIERITSTGAKVHSRRLSQKDVEEWGSDGARLYLCTAPALRKQVLEWLPGREVIFEDFNF